MKYFFISIFLASISACAQAPSVKKVEYKIMPGEMRFVNFPNPKFGAKLICRNSEVRYSIRNNGALAIIVEKYSSSFLPFNCQVELADNTLYEMIFSVEEKTYKSEQLKVDKKTIKLSDEDQKRADDEQVILNKIYASSANDFLFDDAFVIPMTSKVTSEYGTRRVYNKQKKSPHLGTDFRAAIGDKVPATNKGKVVFAGDLFYTGWTVIIDHGLDLFTVYGHLSQVLVKDGEMVDKGQLIGLSGNTGRTSGPHLHWGVKIQKEYLDGFVLKDESEKYYRK